MKPAAPELDPFLSDLLALEGSESSEASAEGLLSLSEALEPVAPPADLRARLLSEVTSAGRFERFASSVAKLLDLGIDRARALLDQLDDHSLFESQIPGISFYWCGGGPAVANALRGFLRIKAGVSFPDHEHIGLETVLVLQGSFVDPSRGITVSAGEIDVMPAGSAHAYSVPPDGPDLLLLSVTQGGIHALGTTFLPR